MRLILLGVLLLLSTVAVQAQSNCACCTTSHEAFDFWVGDWEVYTIENEKLGESTVSKLEKDCVIQEEWHGESGVTGRSFNYFDPSDSKWNQLWLDSGGSNLKLKGEQSDDSMVLQSGLTRGKKISWYYDRITYTKIDDNTVSQVWQILDANERPVTTVFHGVYRRKS
ncbi:MULTISPECIES: hypothetical protein [Reichenbachiella]|uniref:Lipocalin-like domain-containing protein n=1 Tax=Reichenbachiella agariperforans TaxID=156994 RepID=A0A1M6TEV7_REIAG|nr:MULTISPECIES: hypothetical protein [Reichenbachiella]RJE71519.1 hypothetical protein BGP76_05320 [Reichenbachiella sp. MSK19-1]SHK55535.1 hypothetical protein SAMN04488028_10614 [Reichenbachiella agariperforans]